MEKDKQKNDLTERRKKREEMQRQREQNELIHPHPNHAKSFTSHHRIGFEDKRVVVSGKFKPTIGPINPGDKKLCIKDKCEVSKGNGIWYSSPLEIESIRAIK